MQISSSQFFGTLYLIHIFIPDGHSTIGYNTCDRKRIHREAQTCWGEGYLQVDAHDIRIKLMILIKTQELPTEANTSASKSEDFLPSQLEGDCEARKNQIASAV